MFLLRAQWWYLKPEGSVVTKKGEARLIRTSPNTILFYSSPKIRDELFKIKRTKAAEKTQIQNSSKAKTPILSLITKFLVNKIYTHLVTFHYLNFMSVIFKIMMKK